MKYTTNYKFKKPEGTEPVNFDDINDSFDLIDETLRKQDDILETEYFYPTISNGVLKSNSPMLNTFSGWVNAIKYNGQSFTHARVYVNIENECDVIYSILDSNKNIIIECTKHIYHPGYCVFEFPRKITNSDITGSVFYFSIRSKAGASRIAYSILDTIKDYYYASDYPDYYYTTSTPDTLYPCDVKSKYYIKVDLIDCTSNVIIPDANDRLDLLEAKLQNISVILPQKIDAVIGDTLEIFYKGIIKTIDYTKFNVNVTASKGNRYKRKWVYVPQVEDTNFPLIIDVYDDFNNKIATGTTMINISNKKVNPSSVKNVLCVGDDLTTNGKYVTEFQRRLCQTDGSPVGDGLSNIEFIGTKGTSPANYEGYDGWKWDSYINNGNPFYNTSVNRNDFINYCSVNSFSGIDYCFILLGWNEIGNKAFTPESYQTTIDNAKTFINQLHTDYPNCKIAILGLEVPSFDGLGYSYGSNIDTWNYYFCLQSVFALNIAYQNLASDPTYSGFVDFIQTSAVFDSDNNMQAITANVNVRSNKTELLGSDGVHPALEGYLQIADAVYRNIMSKID